MVSKVKALLKKLNQAQLKGKEDYFFIEIPGTNLLLAKNKEKKMGFIIYNDKQLSEGRFYLENFSYRFSPKLQSPKNTKIFKNCSVITSNQFLDDDFFCFGDCFII